MNIALIVNQNQTIGGGFQYELTMLKTLTRRQSDNYKYSVISFNKENIVLLNNLGIKSEYFNFSIKSKIDLFLRKNHSLFKPVLKIIRFLQYSSFDKYLLKKNIDIAYFLSPSGMFYLLDRCNFIATVWDLLHRDYPEFPEVRECLEFEERESMLRSSLSKAVAVIVESELGRINVAQRYQVDKNRIVKIPFFIDEDDSQVECDIKRKYGIEGNFIFYPAQFWAHKNHVFILDSLYELKNTFNRKIYAFFPGTDKGNLSHVKAYAKLLQIEDQISFPGFLPRDEIIACYKQALALVNPTYCGPTNIPPLEALYYKCLVIHPNFFGFREQTENAALYIDCDNPSSLTQLLIKIYDSIDAFKDYKIRGLKLLKKFSKEQAVVEVEKILSAYQITLKTWKI